MTRGRNTIVDVTDLPDGTHEILWSHGQRTIADADQLRRLELRESWLSNSLGPLDAA